MTKTEFISLLEEYLEKTGMSCGNWDAFLSVGDEENRNTTIYVDKEGFVWITADESVKRVKTSINVQDVIELRYSQYGSDDGRFFVICSNYEGLDFCEGEIGYFANGYYGDFHDAVDWFTANPIA